jgi:hypothetical protein
MNECEAVATNGIQLLLKPVFMEIDIAAFTSVYHYCFLIGEWYQIANLLQSAHCLVEICFLYTEPVSR